MKKKTAICFSLAAMGALIFASGNVLTSCRNALRLCVELIIPSLFPFFVLSGLLNKLGLPDAVARILAPCAKRLFGVSGRGASALIIGLLGGYPLGAAYIADMRRAEEITREEGEQLIGFCNNTGPAFIIGAVGAGVFSSARAGIYLYLAHILSAVLTGILTHSQAPRAGYASPPSPTERKAEESFAEAFTHSLKEAVLSILNVCGFVVCFSVVVSMAELGGGFSLAAGWLAARTKMELHWVRALLTGILELGSGVGAMKGLSTSPITLALAAFLIGWGGISVHFQTRAVLSDSDIKGVLHFAGRLISASIAACIAYFAYPVVF